MDIYYEGFQPRKKCGFEQIHNPHIYRQSLEGLIDVLTACPGVRASDICDKHSYKLVVSTRDFHTYSCKKCKDMVTVNKDKKEVK